MDYNSTLGRRPTRGRLPSIRQRSPIRRDADILREHIPSLPEPRAHGVLVVVSGLPGTGKSHFSATLAERTPMAIVETDVMRRVLSPTPKYTAAESARLFKACHLLMEDLLLQGITVLFDATNLVEAHRERLYNVAHKTDARLIVVRVEAPVEVISRRLEDRETGVATGGNSTADRSVYRRMVATVEPIRRNHYVVDTSRDITPVVEKVSREIDRWAGI